MKSLLLTILISANSLWAHSVRVSELKGAQDGLVIRDKSKLQLAPQFKLKMNDRILSNRSEVTLALQNGSSLKMAKESELQLTKKGFVFYKGRGLFTLKQEQLVEAPEVSFNSSNSQFELSVINNSLTHLDVVKGEVTVSSPHIQTFVPEIVKAREGLSFDKSKPAFNRREFNPQMSQK